MPRTEARLLLVDDDPSAIQTLSRMLAQVPQQRFATSGEAALRLAREAPPDLILLDADMPGMTGFDVCDALKADAALAHIPIIFVTSHDAPHLEAAALERGAVDFITKPLVAAQVTARVRTRLRLKRMIEDAQLGTCAADDSLDESGVPRARLLIVDDDIGAVRLLHRTLVTMGTIHCATRGDDAVQLARRVAPDLILLDAQIPGMDGLAVCEALKSEAAFEHVPIVFVTRFSDPRTERRAFELGAADFIRKPFPPAVVKARVRNLLEQRRSMRAPKAQESIESAERARRDAEAATHAKNRRLCGIAHEMGNPLNGVLGFAQLMLADAVHPLPPKQAERLRLIVASAERLRVLVRDISDLGRIESGDLSIRAEPTDVVPHIRAAAGAVEGLAHHANVTVSYRVPAVALHAMIDGGRLQQCLANLLTNGIKYNRPGGRVDIELQDHGSTIAIVVSDDGIGMDAEQLQHLFEPFNRLGRQSSATPGHGLGLSITHELTRAMGGRLSVQSTPASGSRFVLWLPAAPGADATGPATEGDASV